MSDQKIPLTLWPVCVLNLLMSIIFLVSGLVGEVMPSAVDLGGSAAAIVAFIVLLPVPIVCFAGAIFPIFFAQNGHKGHARLLAVIPFVWALVAGALSLFILYI